VSRCSPSTHWKSGSENDGLHWPRRDRSGASSDHRSYGSPLRLGVTPRPPTRSPCYRVPFGPPSRPRKSRTSRQPPEKQVPYLAEPRAARQAAAAVRQAVGRNRRACRRFRPLDPGFGPAMWQRSPAQGRHPSHQTTSPEARSHPQTTRSPGKAGRGSSRTDRRPGASMTRATPAAEQWVHEKVLAILGVRPGSSPPRSAAKPPIAACSATSVSRPTAPPTLAVAVLGAGAEVALAARLADLWVRRLLSWPRRRDAQAFWGGP
jgi:hypothetical protein